MSTEGQTPPHDTDIPKRNLVPHLPDERGSCGMNHNCFRRTRTAVDALLDVPMNITFLDRLSDHASS